MAADDCEKLRQLLLAAAPLFACPPPIHPVLQPTTIAELMAYLSSATGAHTNHIMSLMNPPSDDLAWPQQGGQCITEDWLHALKRRDCLWHFRYVNVPTLHCS
jgi:hypothetical protein